MDHCGEGGGRGGFLCRASGRMYHFDSGEGLFALFWWEVLGRLYSCYLDPGEDKGILFR